jgi:hypothetical protein
MEKHEAAANILANKICNTCSYCWQNKCNQGTVKATFLPKHKTCKAWLRAGASVDEIVSANRWFK